MGISKGTVRLLLAEAAERPFSGRVLQLGRQYMHFSVDQLSDWASLHKVTLHPEKVANNKRPPIAPDIVDDGTVFALLGFDEVESCDVSTDEDPTYIVDLNLPVASNLIGRYDVIVDGGTIEHVFNTPQSLANVHAMLKPGGRIIHISPSTNHIDHGFYMFSPTLFADYYAANRYKICNLLLFEYGRDHATAPWKIYRYESGSLESMSFCGFDQGTAIGIFVSAQKMPDSDYKVVPQQHVYLSLWKDSKLQAVRDAQYDGSTGAITAKPRNFLMAYLRRRFWKKSIKYNLLRPIDAYKIAEY